MTSVDLFRRIVAALNEAGIPFMLTGSFAGSWHGMTRATQDVAALIRLRGEEIDLAYVESWVENLGLRDQWTLARRMA